MNSRFKTILNNFSYSLFSNVISLIISTLVVMIVPKLIGVSDYSYWQLYLFYSSYVGFLHFGFNDGVYLKHGGEKYEDLDKNHFFSQFVTLLIFQIVIASIIMLFIPFGGNKAFILQMTTITMIIVNVRGFFVYILQATNRIKDYAKVTVTDRFLYALLIISLLVFGVSFYKFFILFDIIGKFITLLVTLHICKDIVFKNISKSIINIKTSLFYISIGIKLMLANIASMLIIGTVRFGIEYNWGVEVFGKVSLTLSVSNLLMIFVNSLGIVMFPVLRRVTKTIIPKIYTSLKSLFIISVISILFIYYPLRYFLDLWLPTYQDSLVYMSMLFPIIVFEGKMALLINPILKTLRKENELFVINLLSFVLSIILTISIILVTNNLTATILLIVILLCFRNVIAELYISKLLKIKLINEIVLEIFVVTTFIASSWYLNPMLSILVYLSVWIIYVFVNKTRITSSVTYFKNISMKE